MNRHDDDQGAPPARRPIWTGSIALGLIHIPVRLYPMIRSSAVPFRLLHAADGQPVRYERVCSKDGAVIPWSEIAKGYEIGKGEFVMFTKEELEALKPESGRSIRLDTFVFYHAMDPVYFDTPYLLVPDASGDAYALLHAVFEAKGRAGVGRVTLRSRERPVLVHAYQGALVMTTLRYAEEVTAPGSFEELSALPEPGRDELKLAEAIVENLTGEFALGQYHDRYRERVLALIAAKAKGGTITVETPKAEEVRDLMSALQETLEKMKAR